MSSPAQIPAAQPAVRAGHTRMHLLMLVVVVCWASNIIAGKEALKGFGALALAQLRVLVAAGIYAFWFLASGRLRRLQLSPRKWFFLLAMAASGIALNQLTFIGGMARTTVAHTGLIVALGPVMVLVIAVVIRYGSADGMEIRGDADCLCRGGHLDGRQGGAGKRAVGSATSSCWRARWSSPFTQS